MKIDDRVWGQINIEEAVIKELIDSASLQRLKKIDQAGYFDVHFPGSKHTRFEHSVGDYELLRRYGAPLEEQIAGLLHDVSHSAFSHCIDYIFSAGSQKDHSYQDNIFVDYVKKTEIPAILEKYGLDVDYIINENNFPLQENNIPDICADRIDYSLRSAIAFGVISRDEAQGILGTLKADNGKWFFDSFKSARRYARLFYLLNDKYYSGMPTALMFLSVAQTMRYALEKGYIAQDELYLTDSHVLERVKEKVEEDSRLKVLWERMNNRAEYVNDPEDHEEHIYCKSRVVDPLFIENGELKRVSDREERWKDIVKRGLKPKEYFIKYI